MRSRIRLPECRRPLRADRAACAPDRRRIWLPQPLHRPARGGRDDPGTDPVDRARGVGPVRRCRDPRRGQLERFHRRERAARVRAGRVRPPDLRPVLLGHDRAPEADRARPRRPADRAPQEPRSRLGSEARRSAAVVLDHGVDDVERARGGTPAALLDRDARRRPGVARPARAVAPCRGAPADRHGCRPRVPDGVPQGRDRAGARVRPLEYPDAVHGGIAAAPGGLSVCLRATRARDAAEQRLRRHRRLHGTRVGQLRPAGVRGRDHGRVPGRRRARVRSPRATR